MARILPCALLLFMLARASAADLYKVLGVDEKGSQQEIKKAFHKLSLKYHPDKNPSKHAEKKFSEISNAYEILSDEEKRKQYDITGDASGQYRFNDAHPGGGFPGAHPGGGFPGGGFPGGQQQRFHYDFQGGQNFEGWSNIGQFWNQYKGAQKEGASQDSGWGGFGFPFFGKGETGAGGFSGDLFSSLFGAAKRGFQDYRGSGGASQAGYEETSEAKFGKGLDTLDAEQFQQRVLEQEHDAWLVFFYMPSRPGQLKERVGMLNRVTQDLVGVMKAGAISCQINEKLCREQTPSTIQTGAPSLLFYPQGTGKMANRVPYKGVWTDKAVGDFCINVIPNRSNRLDNRKLIGRWAKILDMPQAVLFTNKKDTPAKWRALSCQFDKRIQFYDVHVDSNMDPLIAQQFGIQSYPAVLGVIGNGEDYLLLPENVYMQSGYKMMGKLTRFLEDLEIQSKAAGVGSNGPQWQLDVPVLTKANSAVVCGSSTPLCVIAMVDLKKGGEKARNILSEISQKTLVQRMETIDSKKPSVTFSLVDPWEQRSFVRAFTSEKAKNEEIFLVAYKRRKGKFVLRKGIRTPDDAETFVRAALTGDLTFKTLPKDPVLS